MADLIDDSPKNENSNENNKINIENNDHPLPMMAAQLNPFFKNDNQSVEENFSQYLQSVCCPEFKFLSTTFILSMLQLFIYFIMICYGIRKDATELLAPKFETLVDFGLLIPSSIKHGNIWRWVTSVFLHANFIHLFFNIITQIIIGSYIEAIIGQVKTILVYIFAVISSGIFTCCISKDNGTTSTTILFSIVGIYLSYTCLNFFSLDTQIGVTNKICNLLFIMFMLTINIINAYNNSLILPYANIASLLFSFFFGMCIITPYKKGDGLFVTNKIWFWIGVGFCSVLVPLELILFFTVTKV